MLKRDSLNEIEKRMPSIRKDILKIPEVARYQSYEIVQEHLWEIRVKLDKMRNAIDEIETQEELEI